MGGKGLRPSAHMCCLVVVVEDGRDVQLGETETETKRDQGRDRERE